MIYPTLHLHRPGGESATDYYVQPARIVDIEPVAGGGAMLTIEGRFGDPVEVNESPSMIAEGIRAAIVGSSALATKGNIEMQISANQALAQQEKSRIIQARGGLPPINGG